MEFFFIAAWINSRQHFVKACCIKSTKKYEKMLDYAKNTCVFTMIFIEVEFYLAIA